MEEKSSPRTHATRTGVAAALHREYREPAPPGPNTLPRIARPGHATDLLRERWGHSECSPRHAAPPVRVCPLAEPKVSPRRARVTNASPQRSRVSPERSLLLPSVDDPAAEPEAELEPLEPERAPEPPDGSPDGSSPRPRRGRAGAGQGGALQGLAGTMPKGRAPVSQVAEPYQDRLPY